MSPARGRGGAPAGWPDNRLVPYVMTGVGGSYVEIKDVKPPGFNLHLSGKNLGVAATFGTGLDYMVARNIALGAEVAYLLTRGHSFSVQGESQSVKIDALLMTAGIRIFFGRGRAVAAP